MIGLGMVSFPIGKFISDRAVCAPKYLFFGTSRAPKESVSIRLFSFMIMLSSFD